MYSEYHFLFRHLVSHHAVYLGELPVKFKVALLDLGALCVKLIKLTLHLVISLAVFDLRKRDTVYLRAV